MSDPRLTVSLPISALLLAAGATRNRPTRNGARSEANRLEEIVSDDLVAFLRARLDEDEAVARAAFPAPWTRRDKIAGVHGDDATPQRPFGSTVADCRRVPPGHGWGDANANHITRHDPGRVFAEVEAKRGVIARFETAFLDAASSDHLLRSPARAQLHELIPVLCLLALPHADHPDYREEWRP